MTLIKIDRLSIRKNPNAGKNEYFIPGRSIITATWDASSAELPVGITGHVYGYQRRPVVPGSPTLSYYNISAYIESPTDVAVITTLLGPTAKVVVDTVHQRVATLFPEPEFFYDHLPTDVTCAHCQKSFDYKLLRSDTQGEGDDAVSLDYTCPHCYTPECTEHLVYEQLTEEMKIQYSVMLEA